MHRQRTPTVITLAVGLVALLTVAPASAQFDRKADAYDLDTYVLGKALDGLFHVVGDEERKIRTNPAARATDLLKEVFAKR